MILTCPNRETTALTDLYSPVMRLDDYASATLTDWLQTSDAVCVLYVRMSLYWPVCSAWCCCAPSAAGQWVNWSRWCKGCRSAASAWDNSWRWSRWWRTLYRRTQLRTRKTQIRDSRSCSWRNVNWTLQGAIHLQSEWILDLDSSGEYKNNSDGVIMLLCLC